MRFVTWLLCLWLSCSVLDAQIEDFDARRKQGTDLRLQGLQEHADWLKKQKLTGTRLEILALIVEFDPENEAARKSLGYKRKKGGGWVEPRRPKKSSDKNPRMAKQEPERRAAAMKPFMDYHLALLEEAKSDRGQRAILARDVLRLDPDNEVLHGILEHVRVGDKWVSKQSLVVAERRAKIAETLEAAMRKGGKKSAATPKEAAFSVEWSSILETPEGRILGTLEEEQVQTCAKQVQALMGLYRLMLNPKAEVPEGFGVFLMNNEEEGDAFLKGLKGIEDSQRPELLKQQGLWLSNSNQVAHWSSEPQRRLDAAARLLLQNVLREDQGVTLKQPWLHEGLGMYLGFLVTGTRLTWFLACPESPKWSGEESARLEMLYARDWRHLGARYLQHPARPDVAEFVTKHAAEFDALDLLYSYLFVAYLSEAYPDELGSVVRGISTGGRPETVFKRRLDRSYKDLDSGLQEWIERYVASHPALPVYEEGE